MLGTRAMLAAAASLAIIAALSGASHAGGLNAYATCADGSHISFNWSWYEDPGSQRSLHLHRGAADDGHNLQLLK